MFAIPEAWTQHPRMLDRITELFRTVQNLPTVEAQRERWSRDVEILARAFPSISAADDDLNLAPTRATARILIFFENRNASQEAVEIDGVRFGLLRNPNRFNAQREALEKFEGRMLEKDSSEFEELMKLLHESDADNITSLIYNMHSKLTHIKVDNVEDVPAAPEDAELPEQPVHSVGIVSHPYVDAAVEVGDDKTLRFVSKASQTLAGDCLRQAVKDCFGVSDAPNVFRLKDLVPWMRERRLGFTAFDKLGRQIFDYSPKDDGRSRNTHASKAHMYLLVHNNHATLLDKDLNSLCHKPERRAELLPQQPSCKYPATVLKQHDNHFVESFDELVDFFAQTQDQSGETFYVHYNDDLEALFFKLLDDYGMEAEPRVTGGTISGLTLRLQNTYKLSDFPLQNPEEGRMPIQKDCYDAWMGWMQRFADALLGPSLKSQYCPNLMAVWSALPKAQLHRRMAVDAPEKALGIDIVRAYTANLLSIDTVPVFLATDDFMAYDGGALQPHSIYLVENTASQPDECIAAWFIANRRWNLVSGHVLAAVLPRARSVLRIEAVIRPSHLAPCPTRTLIEGLYADAGLTDVLKKFTVNAVIGLTNKKYAQLHRAVYTTDPVEAKHFSKNLFVMRRGRLLAHQSSERVPLLDGFMPLGFAVYDRMRLRLLETYDALVAAGAKVYGVATDCFFVDSLPAGITLTSSKTLADFGKLHDEGLKRVPLTLWDIEQNKNPVVLPRRTHEAVLSVQPGTIITGVLPGSGKTHLLATTLPRDDTLWLTATNEQQLRLCSEYPSLNAMTLCKFLKLRVGNEGLTAFGQVEAPAYDHIVIDEIYQQSVVALAHLRACMQKHSQVHWYATGDLHQTSAAESLNNLGDRGAYLSILADMFPKTYCLQTCWRVLPEQVPVLMALRKALFEDRKSPAEALTCFPWKTFSSLENSLPFKKALTLSNLTAQIVNRHISGAAQSLPRFEVVCKAYHRDLVMNQTYTVTAVAGTKYTLENGRSYDKSWFRAPHCFTGHSVQGSTIDEAYAIFDLTSPHASREWVWVCITRATDLRNVYLYTGPSLGRNLDIEAKLRRYRAMDGAGCNLTTSWVLATLKKQNYCCAICQDMLDLLAPGDNPWAWSVDRQCNSLPHSKENCAITHVHCNTRTH